MKNKRHSTESHTFLLAAHKAAGTLLEIPPEIPEMSERAEALYHMFGQGKARDDWFPHELIHLAQLAVMTVSYQDVMARLEKEGFVVTNARGTQIQNPLFSIGDTILRMSLALSRSLGLASVSNANKQTTTKRAMSSKEANDAQKFTRTSKVSLLASPTPHKKP
jgi:hypothetical protein